MRFVVEGSRTDAALDAKLMPPPPPPWEKKRPRSSERALFQRNSGENRIEKVARIELSQEKLEIDRDTAEAPERKWRDLSSCSPLGETQ